MKKARTSAPLVKVNSIYMKHKVWPRQPCCTGWSYWPKVPAIQYKLGPKRLPVYCTNWSLFARDDIFIVLKLYVPTDNFTIPTDNIKCINWQIYLPTDNFIYQLTTLFTNWQLYIPTDSDFYQLTILYTYWQFYIPTDNFIYQLTTLYTNWQQFLPTDNFIYQLTTLCNNCQLYIPTDTHMYQLTHICTNWQLCLPLLN